MSGKPLQPYRKGVGRRQFLTDLPENVRSKGRQRRGQSGKDRARVGGKKNVRVVGAAGNSKELEKRRRLQQKNLNILGRLKRKR